MHSTPFFIVVGALWLLLIMALTLETVPLKKVCRNLGVSEETFYNLKKYGGLWRSDLWRLRQLEEENAKLKRLAADLPPSRHMTSDVIWRADGG
jgi:putative transposase